MFLLIQTRQDASLGDHDLRNFGRVMRGITEDNNFQFLLQVDAIKDNTFSRLLCYSDCDHFVPHNVAGSSNIYEDVTVCLSSISKTHVSSEDKNVKTKAIITSDVDLLIDQIAETRVNISHGSHMCCLHSINNLLKRIDNSREMGVDLNLGCHSKMHNCYRMNVIAKPREGNKKTLRKQGW